LRTDQFLVSIPLSASETTVVGQWLDRFRRLAVHAWSDPSIADGTLTIHPADFPNLLTYAHPTDCTEFEFYRIRKFGASAITAALSQKHDRVSTELRSMTLSALEGLRASSPDSGALPEFIDPDIIQV